MCVKKGVKYYFGVQVKYYSDAHRIYSELTGKVLSSPMSEDDIAFREQELHEQTADKLSAIKALSITGEV